MKLAEKIVSLISNLNVEKSGDMNGNTFFITELPTEREESDEKDRCVSATHNTIIVYKNDCIIPGYTVSYHDIDIKGLGSGARKIYKAFEKRHTEIQGQIYESKMKRLQQTLGLV